MLATPAPQENRILGALSSASRDRVFPHLKLVRLPLGMVLYESRDAIRSIYFPTDSVISMLHVLEDGATAVNAIVGNDGAIGVALLMGGATTPSRTVVQSAGFAYTLTGKRLKEESSCRTALVRHGLSTRSS